MLSTGHRARGFPITECCTHLHSSWPCCCLRCSPGERWFCARTEGPWTLEPQRTALWGGRMSKCHHSSRYSEHAPLLGQAYAVHHTTQPQLVTFPSACLTRHLIVGFAKVAHSLPSRRFRTLPSPFPPRKHLSRITDEDAVLRQNGLTRDAGVSCRAFQTDVDASPIGRCKRGGYKETRW